MSPSRKPKPSASRLPGWLVTVLPLAALAGLVAVMALTNPLAVFQANLPPIEILNFERVLVTETGFEATLINAGPSPVTIAQVLVDDAYWNFEISPSTIIPRLGRAMLTLEYPWVEGDMHVITALTDTGVAFEAEIPVATLSPTAGQQEILAYGLLGVYVGILPVGLGMLWYPAMRRAGRRALGAILALTIGLLVFLLVDTILEALEVAGDAPGPFQGVPLVIFAALLTWMAISAVGASQRSSDLPEAARRQGLATRIALGIGLHNLGEGLAIGAAFAIGEVALGSFLVIGFTLHNVTEGVGIAAPLIPGPDSREAGPKLGTFVTLTILAGAPAILGAWIGGFAFSPVLAALFLGVGAGAIWQVIVDVTALLRRTAERHKTSLLSPANGAGFVAGILIMYVTALLVKF
ncbi:MAG: hypothetical protein WD040_05600 [Anaerolineales bacterium]